MGKSTAPPTVRIAARDGVITVAGPLNFDTVPGALQSSLALLPASGTVTVDLGGVTHADSAALALIVEWQRSARARQLTLTLRAPPPQLRALAAATGLDTLLA